MVRGLTWWALAVRETPRACWRRLPGSPRLRVLRLLRETSPGLLIMLGLFVVADGVLPAARPRFLAVAGGEMIDDESRLPATVHVIETGGSGDHRRVLLRADGPVHDSHFGVRPVNLEDLVLAYMGRAAHGEDRHSPLPDVRP